MKYIHCGIGLHSLLLNHYILLDFFLFSAQVNNTVVSSLTCNTESHAGVRKFKEPFKTRSASQDRNGSCVGLGKGSLDNMNVDNL